MLVTDEGKKKAWRGVGVVIGIALVILVLSANNLVPDNMNIFKLFEEGVPPTLVDGEGWIDGFPTEVNVTAQVNNSYPLTFVCNESCISGMELTITLGDDLVNTSAYWTATTTDWQISDDQLEVVYIGDDALTGGIELEGLVLHIDDGVAEDEITLIIITDVGDLTPDEVTIDVIL